MNELQTAIWKAKEALLLNKFFFTKSIIMIAFFWTQEHLW